MKIFTRIILSFFMIALLVSVSIAEVKSDYEKKVEEVVESYVNGETLSQEGIEILAQVIASKNSQYFSQVFEVYFKANLASEASDSPSLVSGIALEEGLNKELLITQFEEASGIMMPYFNEPKSIKNNNNSITVSSYTESGDAGDMHDLPGAQDPGFVSEINGYFHSSNDVDVYKLVINNPNETNIYLEFSDSLFQDPWIALLDEFGNLQMVNIGNPNNPYFSHCGGPTKSRKGSVITFCPPGPAIESVSPLFPVSPGTYYLVVSATTYDSILDEDCFPSWDGSTYHPDGYLGPSEYQPAVNTFIECFPYEAPDYPFSHMPWYTVHIEGLEADVTLPPPTINQWTIREDTYFRKTFPTGPTYSASSNTYFVQPRFNGSVIYITPAANWNGTAKITVNASGTTKDYYLRVTPVNDRPVIYPIANQILEANQMGTVNLGGRDIDNQFLTFTASSSQSGLTTSISGRTLTLTPQPDWSGTAQVTVLVSDGFLTDAWVFNVTVNTPASSVFRRVAGYMYYGDTDESIEESNLELRNEEGNVYTTPISADGEFEFESVANGYYDLAIVKEDDPEVLTAADALLTLRRALSNQQSFFSYILDEAADVDASNTVTASDALNILYRVIGTTNSFVKPDWITAQPQIGVGAEDLQLPLWAIKTGDLDKSFLNPNLGKRNILYKSGEYVKVKEGEEIVVPVKIGSLSDFAAFDMTLKYDSENLDFLGVNSNLGVLSNAVNDEIKLAWLNTNLENSITLDEGSTLLELRFNTKGKLSKGYKTELVPTKGEFISKDGSKQNPLITISGISESTPMNFDLAQNYPNPFNPSTQITYSLPIKGQVELTIFDVVGQKVATLVNEAKEAGNHKVEWNAKNIPSGVYFYTLNVNGSQNYRTTKKMLLVK